MKQVVIGLGYGDEGKGLVVDWLARKDNRTSVVRYSGGHQVGHCVRTEGKKHIFSNFGSGTLSGRPTIWRAKTCDPVGIWNEYLDLKSKFLGINPLVHIHPDCPVTTPFDKAWNQNNNLHGSIGVGFGATIQREEDHYHLTYGDLQFPSVLQNKIELIMDYYESKGLNIFETLPEWQRLDDFKEACREVISRFPPKKMYEINCIYESSQGLMLDMDYGYFPYVTRSRLGLQEIEGSIGLYPEVYFVTRAYQTRHGAGPLHNESIDVVALDETNVYNDYQGEFRVRALNLDELNYVLSKQETFDAIRKYLVITCLDQMKEYKFVHQGEVYRFDDEESYIKGVLDKLNFYFTQVFISHGPTANNISEYKGDK